MAPAPWCWTGSSTLEKVPEEDIEVLATPPARLPKGVVGSPSLEVLEVGWGTGQPGQQEVAHP